MTNRSLASSSRASLLLWLALGGLLAWTVWLRYPSLAAPVWNADEAVHRTVADVIHHGGVLYRDAIDHRGPVSYYVAAGLTAIGGLHLWVLRLAVTVGIALVAVMVAGLVRRDGDRWSAAIGALAVVAFSCGLLIPQDSRAAHTEWLVIVFTSTAAIVFWTGRTGLASGRRATIAGVALGLAFMTKQSALLELAPALAALAFGAFLPEQRPRTALRGVLCCLAGAGFTIGVLCWIFAAAVGWETFWFQFWTYNVEIYGPEIPLRDRLATAPPWFVLLARHYPLVFAAGIGGGLWVALRTAQFRADPDSAKRRPREVYMLVWAGAALGGAISGGRGFGHYLIVCFPAFAWVAGWCFARISARLERAPMALAALRVITLVSVALVPIRYRAPEKPLTAADTPIVPLVQALTTREDSIFVWGFNADLYALTDRLPATRFLYCSFPTGFVPWTNTAPEIDTRYAVVPGSLELLVQDLARSQPRVVVDYAVTPGREFGKYPLHNFPLLDSWLVTRYGAVDPQVTTPHAANVLARCDWEATGQIDPLPVTAASTAVDTETLPQPGVIRANVQVYSDTGDVTGIGLWAEGVGLTRLTFPATAGRTWQVPVNLGPDATSLVLVPLIQRANGPWEKGSPLLATIDEPLATPEQAREFALPFAPARVPASALRLSFGGGVNEDAGARDYNIHAPHLLRYRLPPDAGMLRGSFLLPENAYADDNPSPTDGVEFIVRVLPAGGAPRELLRRHLAPRQRPEDRGRQDFVVTLPADLPPDSILELEATAGPNGNKSSDWASWLNLLLEAAPPTSP